MIHHVETWLKQKPRKSEIVEIQTGKVKDGKTETVKIIPQKIIETLLDELTEQNWSTRNFQFSRFTTPLLSGGIVGQEYGQKTMCDASLELVVTYRVLNIAPLHEHGSTMIEKEITRVLVGAVSFDVSLFGNDHIANTAKSLCITNAASDLGRRFGKDLNPKEASIMIVGIKQPISVEVKDKIGETLGKLKEDLSKKTIG